MKFIPSDESLGYYHSVPTGQNTRDGSMKRNYPRIQYSVLGTRSVVRASPDLRAAHSLIEILVVLIIVSVLIAIVVPAVQRARESARMADCIHRQAQLAKAIHMHVADEPYGRFPGYRAFAADGTMVGWAPQVFEYLGRSDLPSDPADATFIDQLTCPSDQRPQDSPRLNYVVNGGRADIDSPADGIFFDHAKAEKVYITKDDFRDGLTNTILIAENLDATEWNVTDEANQCILWPLVEGSEVNVGSGSRPSSHHPGGFVAAFADGSVKFMSETDINEDPAVHTAGSFYTALLTPGGDDDFPTTVDGVNPCDQEDEEAGVNDALDWIVRHQFFDGSWSLKHSAHPDCNGSCSGDGVFLDSRVPATGIALLPLLGSGHAPGSGAYADNVCRGLEYLLARQDPTTGSLLDGSYSPGRTMYGHLVATLALTEAVLLSDDVTTVGGCSSGVPCGLDLDELRARTQLAVEYAIAIQVPDDGNPGGTFSGGWGYTPSQVHGDTSLHLWGAAIMMNAKRLGFDVPDETIERLGVYLDSAQSEPVTDQGVTLGNYRYAYYQGTNGLWGEVTNSMTANGLMMRIWLGAPKDHAKVTSFLNDPALVPWLGEPYYNLHVTQLRHLVGGSQWDQWNTAIQDHLNPLQATSGHEKGSWYWGSSPNEPRAAGEWNITGGRLYCTAFSLLCLEQYFSRLKLSRNGGL